MRLRMSNRKWAFAAAVGLTCFAILIVFGFNPGGFETQGVWLLVLLPAGLAVYPLADFVHEVAPRLEPIVFWVLMAGFNFIWYWIISFAVIKYTRGDTAD